MTDKPFEGLYTKDSLRFEWLKDGGSDPRSPGNVEWSFMEVCTQEEEDTPPGIVTYTCNEWHFGDTGSAISFSAPDM